MSLPDAGIFYLETMSGELRMATGSTAVKLDLVNATRARIWEAVASLQSVALYAEQGNQQQMEANEKHRQAAAKRVQEQIATIRPLMTSADSIAQLDSLERHLNDFETVSADYLRVCRGASVGWVSGSRTQATSLRGFGGGTSLRPEG